MDIIKVLTNLIKKTMTNQITEVYCLKCKKKQKIVNPQEVVMNKKGGKTGRALTGTCTVCGTKMYRILGAKKDNPVTSTPTFNSTPASETIPMPTQNSEPTSSDKKTIEETKPTIENEMDSFDEANK